MNPFFYVVLVFFLVVLPARSQVVYPLHQEVCHQTLNLPNKSNAQHSGWMNLRQPLGVNNLLSADINYRIQTDHHQICFQYLVNRFPGFQSHQVGSRISVNCTKDLIFSAALGMGAHFSPHRASISWYVRMDHAFYLKLSQNSQLWVRLSDWLDLIWPDNGHLGRSNLDFMLWQQLTPSLKAMVFVRSGQADWINLGAGIYLVPTPKHQFLITCGLYPSGLGIGYVYNCKDWRFCLMLVQTHLIGTTPSTTLQWQQ